MLDIVMECIVIDKTEPKVTRQGISICTLWVGDPSGTVVLTIHHNDAWQVNPDMMVFSSDINMSHVQWIENEAGEWSTGEQLVCKHWADLTQNGIKEWPGRQSGGGSAGRGWPAPGHPQRAGSSSAAGAVSGDSTTSPTGGAGRGRGRGGRGGQPGAWQGRTPAAASGGGQPQQPAQPPRAASPDSSRQPKRLRT
nr:hypothetical protein HK105_004696 [Polyrhizophydium stewartii]